MEQEEKEIRPKVQFAIYLVTSYKGMHNTGDFQPGLQQEHLHNKRSNKESSQCNYAWCEILTFTKKLYILS
jgi:hypothetical protein